MGKWADWIFFPIELLIVITFLLFDFVNSFVGHIEILSLIFVVRDGSLTSYALEREQFSSHLEADASLEGIGQHIFLHQNQSSKFTLIIFNQKSSAFKIVKQVSMMSGD